MLTETSAFLETELFSIGADTREAIVGADTCAGLGEAGIDHCGLSDATIGFGFVWKSHVFSAILFSFSGAGEALVDGKMVPFRAGTAYLISPRTLAAYRAIDHSRWGVAWTVYHPRHGRQLPFVADRAILINADATPARAAIEGLYSETAGCADPTVMHMWADLLNMYISRTTRQFRNSNELLDLWRAVDGNLSHDWSVEEMANIAQVSREQLRRLCQRQQRCTPMEHVWKLRMRRAQYLLRTSEMKLNVISSMVGYSSPFAFSAAFKRFTGKWPSEYRQSAGSLKHEA